MVLSFGELSSQRERPIYTQIISTRGGEGAGTEDTGTSRSLDAQKRDTFWVWVKGSQKRSN